MKINNLLSEAYKETKKLPKGLLLVAVIMPGGIVTIATYIAGKSLYKTLLKKEEKDASS